MRNLIFVALLTACSTSKITKTVETIDSAKVGLQRKEISAHYIDHQPIEAEAKMVVDVDALGNKTYTNDNFSFTVDAKGGTNFNKERRLLHWYLHKVVRTGLCTSLVWKSGKDHIKVG